MFRFNGCATEIKPAWLLANEGQQEKTGGCSGTACAEVFGFQGFRLSVATGWIAENAEVKP